MLSMFFKYLFFLGPNFIWTLCIFLVLKNDKIKLEKKIMYLLILNVLFMFLDTTISKALFDETVVDISSYIIEILQIGLCVYWGKKKGITNLFSEKRL